MQISGNNSEKKQLVIFASGRGSNARAILDYFKENDKVNIALIISNNQNAGVLELADNYGIESMVINRKMFNKTTVLDQKFEKINIDLIILAGFLWLVPERLIEKYPRKILNIHPALLPKYGGKGMYGMHVHNAVKKAGELESGITIHFIDEEYDKGESVFQAKTSVERFDTPEGIAAKVLKLEHYHYPRVIEKILFS